MKLATLKHPSRRDGELIVVRRDHQTAVHARVICGSLREALEHWTAVSPQLADLSRRLNNGELQSSETFPLDWRALHSPLPRAFQWADGSAFLHHVKLVRQARGAEMPPRLTQVPLMYQGGSDTFLTPTDDIPQCDFAHGTDFEGEVAVITTDVPMGISATKALDYIVLVVLANDVSLRGLIPEELAAGFGFFQSKPPSSFAPLALTLDELAPHWRDGRLHLPLTVEFNGAFFGNASAGEMHFHFGELIQHAARTRPLSAGTLIGSGTVSNADESRGSSCLAEKRMLEQIRTGSASTAFMRPGDHVRMYMRNQNGEDLFGEISQTLRAVE